MKRIGLIRALSLLISVSVPLAGCNTSVQPEPAPLSASNVNLVFLVSEDLSYQAPGDVNPNTANLTNQGLLRSLLMASYLKQQVLGGANATAIYALEATTHLQTAAKYPDLVALETIQQFAMLNQTSIAYDGDTSAADSFPIFASYASGALPNNVAQPTYPCSECQGLDFLDENGDNEALVSGIIDANAPGFYVFSAPWETIGALLANINQLEHYDLTLPAEYAGPNYVYALSITSGSATLITYDSDLNPAPVYPPLPPLKSFSGPCTAAPFHIQVTGGTGGAVIPIGLNNNETAYLVRHAEAHPVQMWDDGNYIAAGQWRALYLPEALLGKIHPTQVYSIDPANAAYPVGTPGSVASSYVRPALTVEPYAIANNLPFNLAASFSVFAQNPPELATNTSNYFFTTNGPGFSSQTLLVAWEHDHIPITVNALLASYNSSQTAPNCPSEDYDTIWTIKLDAQGNLTVDNGMCEGINSAALPANPPQF
jgi:hypothetical protein